MCGVVGRVWNETSDIPGRSARTAGESEVSLSAKTAMVTLTRSISVAAGVFAPGHLGVLTQVVP